MNTRCSTNWADPLVGLVASLVLVGPLLAPGGVLDLDFVLLPHAPVPNGVWGLGPELPRRVPLLLPLAWLDPIIGSVVAGKVMVVAALTAAFVGATRRTGTLAAPWRYAAGVVYALGPFVATRVVVGHLFVLAAMAVLPFALPHLLRPSRDLGRTFLWSLALAMTGVLGGVFALVLVVAGVVGRAGAWRALAAALAAQIPWLAPGVVVAAQGVDLASANGFRPDVTGLVETIAIGAGHGFWQSSFEATWGTPLIAAAGAVVVIGLAVFGRSSLESDLPRLAAIAGASLAVVAASAVWFSAGTVAALLDLPGVGVVREVQRLLPLFLVWAAPAAALGAERLARRWRGARADVAVAIPLVTALVLAAPGLWGGGGRIDPVRLPHDWERVRDLVEAEPGTVLALPWFQYLDLGVADGRRVLNPLPLWLGGDVLAASDPRIPGAEASERADPRSERAQAAVVDNLGGSRVSDDLAALGVRWVVVLADGGLVRGQPFGELHIEALSEDDGFVHVVDGESISAFAVAGWRGSVVEDATGRPVEVTPIFGPFATLDGSGPAVYARPHADGWMRGLSPASISDDGQVALPAGSGLLWYWPTVILLILYIAIGGLAIRIIVGNSRKKHIGDAPDHHSDLGDTFSANTSRLEG